MGGTALLIWGDLDERCLEKAPAKRSLLEVLFGRRPTLRPEKIADWPGQTLFEIKGVDTAPLVGDYREFVREAFPNPWDATQRALDYLNDGTVTVYFRGEQTPEQSQPAWYVQLTFSG